jgi:hypothetical protein
LSDIKGAFTAIAVGAATMPIALLGAAPASAAPTYTAPIHSYAQCPAGFHPSTSGGEAAWTVECSGAKVYVDGWVKDTDADGKCAYVKAFIGTSGRREAKACPKGTTTKFHWSGDGNAATAYLYVA